MNSSLIKYPINLLELLPAATASAGGQSGFGTDEYFIINEGFPYRTRERRSSLALKVAPQGEADGLMKSRTASGGSNRA